MTLNRRYVVSAGDRACPLVTPISCLSRVPRVLRVSWSGLRRVLRRCHRARAAPGYPGLRGRRRRARFGHVTWQRARCTASKSPSRKRHVQGGSPGEGPARDGPCGVPGERCPSRYFGDPGDRAIEEVVDDLPLVFDVAVGVPGEVLADDVGPAVAVELRTDPSADSGFDQGPVGEIPDTTDGHASRTIAA